MTFSSSAVVVAQEGTAAGLPAVRPPRRASRRRMVLLAGFLLPSLALFTTFVIYPMVRAVQMSLYDWDGFGPLIEFIGLSNFQFALADRGFQGAIGHTVFFMAASVLIQLPLALALALLVRRGLPGGRAFRLVLFLPYVFSDVVAAQIWNFLYQPRFGAVNAIIGAVGIPPQDWLGNERLAMPAIFVVMTWKWVGFWMTLYITGLSQIPEEIEEAARMDGVNAWQMIRHITLPMLAPTVRLTAYLALRIYAWLVLQGRVPEAANRMRSR